MTNNIDITPYAAQLGDPRQHVATAQTALTAIEAWQLTDDASYTACAEYLKKCKSAQAYYEEQRKTITQPLNTAKRAVDALFAPIKDKWARVESVLKNKLMVYQARQAAERQRLAQQTAQHHARGDVAMVMTTAAQAQQHVAPQVAGIVTRTVTKWRLIDQSKLPAEYWMPNNNAIDTAVRAGVVVPGVETYEVKSVAAGKS